MIKKEVLESLYYKEKLSMKEISKKLKCSHTQVNYWVKKYSISTRSISESVYIRNNSKGDPFVFRKPKNKEEATLYGLGIGLYWGEGTKANKASIRLGNTDPDLILAFILFLKTFFSISKNELRFGIQVFSDMNSTDVLSFWVKKLKVEKSQFMKIIITPTRNRGTYTKKIQHGVLTVYFHNTKARNVLCSLIEKRRN